MDTLISDLSATPLRVLVFLTALTFIPGIIMSMTAFLRIVIVLSFTRTAMGLQQMPPNQVVIGLSLILTYFVMAPTINEVYEKAAAPYMAGDIDEKALMANAGAPMRRYMLAQTGQDELNLMANLAGVSLDAGGELPLSVVVSAFIVNELRVSFTIGFLLFIPFLVIDLAIAALLNALGMIMLPPTVVALPFKVMIFVLGNGWALVVGSLVKSFRVVS